MISKLTTIELAARARQHRTAANDPPYYFALTRCEADRENSQRLYCETHNTLAEVYEELVQYRSQK